MAVSHSSSLCAVRRQYELFPYPHYPLLLPLRWQEGYLSSPCLAATICHEAGYEDASAVASSRTSNLLIAGCGDTQPSVVQKWLPCGWSASAVDLSRSSVRRAVLRTAFRFPRISYRVEDLDDFLQQSPADFFSHVDAYGVLHHLDRPSQTLIEISRVLKPGGTVRLMVYNNRARIWIRHIQRALILLGINREQAGCVQTARTLLYEIGRVLHNIGHKIQSMPSVMHHDHRFVDCFLHARESQIDLKGWLNRFQDAQLQPVGLLDRFAELDDLTNPLRIFPSYDDLVERVFDGRFENNFEIFLRKEGKNVPRQLRNVQRGRLSPSLLRPPLCWFQYKETKNLPWFLRLKLWKAFLHYIHCYPISRPELLHAENFPKSSMARLARIGVTFPRMFNQWHPTFDAPLQASMEIPEQQPTNAQVSAIIEIIERHLPTGRHAPAKEKIHLAGLRFLRADHF